MKKIIVILAIIIILAIISVLIINLTSKNNNEELLYEQYETSQAEEISNEVDNNQNTENLEEEVVDMTSEEIKINLIVNNKTFSATLENNQTVNELIEMFPLTINMSELNSNEKYYYLNTNLTTNSISVARINAGDIKLYGSNCLVVFYESFSTSYSYTNLGSIDDVDKFVTELGSGSVNITFELAE